jgi:hypothetical protein
LWGGRREPDQLAPFHHLFLEIMLQEKGDLKGLPVSAFPFEKLRSYKTP